MELFSRQTFETVGSTEEEDDDENEEEVKTTFLKKIVSFLFWLFFNMFYKIVHWFPKSTRIRSTSEGILIIL
jgi:hypothetical protein